MEAHPSPPLAPPTLSTSSPLEELAGQCETMLEYRFRDHELLKEALTHASIADDRRFSNERLEFLGDSVLGLVICHRLFEIFPEYLEGDLTKLKSAVVSRNTCAEVANAMGLTELIFVGKGMTGRSGTAARPSSLAAGALESIIAAIYIDGGLEAARAFILRHMDMYIHRFAATTHQQNYKSLLQQHAQKALAATPVYELLDEKGPDHSKCFEVRVLINTRAFGSAWGNAKKQAEQKAAQIALEELGVLAREEKLPSTLVAEAAEQDGDDAAGPPLAAEPAKENHHP
ncbi:MAG TPA: ribonuclease III [Phycisphaerae bacterium]|nr:ribonuclease III [Phycisphaerae bacterium]